MGGEITEEWKNEDWKFTVNVDAKGEINLNRSLHIKEHKFWAGLYQNRIIWYTIFPEGCVILKFYNINKEPTILSDWIGYVSENGIQPILDCETNKFI